VKDFPLALCRSILAGDQTPASNMLEQLGKTLRYELIAGYNGRIWVNSHRPSEVILIFQALERLVEMQCQPEAVDLIMSTVAPTHSKK
jgi:exosome complex RNA-binding protein Rrp4